MTADNHLSARLLGGLSVLKLQVYSESIVERQGIKTKVGEDALPFVNHAGMFVADGMGGSAGIRVISLHPDCFFPEKLAQRISDYCVPDSCQGIVETDLTSYVKSNFSSLANPEMLTLYQDPRSSGRLKKSGYIGSHVLGTLMAAILLVLGKKIEDYPYSWWRMVTEMLPDELIADYRDLIQLLEPECGKTCIDKIDYYGTTLSAALYREDGNYIDVCFWNCGDSRSYVWDQDGFRQAAEDQGRKGGMTSRFSLRNGCQIQISREWKRYKKPCVLYSMTDGVYGCFVGKNGFPSTPLFMEAFLLNVLIRTSSLLEAEKLLTETFDQYQQLDDSHSMAMVAFGFETYPELQAMARKRLLKLEEIYDLKNLPNDFFVEDYVKKATEESGDSVVMNKLQKIKEKQLSVFDDYLKHHLSEVSKDKFLDVEKNGWI